MGDAWSFLSHVFGRSWHLGLHPREPSARPVLALARIEQAACTRSLPLSPILGVDFVLCDLIFLMCELL
jgi:hypothetical protein